MAKTHRQSMQGLLGDIATAEHQPAAAVQHQEPPAMALRFDGIDGQLAELRAMLARIEERTRFLG